MLRNNYQYLKVLIIDEILVIGGKTFEHLDLALKATMRNLLPFRSVSLLVTEDLSQLPHVNQKGVFMKTSRRSYSLYSIDDCGKNSNGMS